MDVVWFCSFSALLVFIRFHALALNGFSGFLAFVDFVGHLAKWVFGFENRFGRFPEWIFLICCKWILSVVLDVPHSPGRHAAGRPNLMGQRGEQVLS